MSSSEYIVARERGVRPAPKMGNSFETQEGRVGPLHAMRASFEPGAQPPFVAACGAPVHEVDEEPWPPSSGGLGKPRACPACTRLVG